VDPNEAAALSREHVEIRTSLDELGIWADLHCTTADAVERLSRALEDHAKREDALMYRWARTNLRNDIPPFRARWLGAVGKLAGPRHRPKSAVRARAAGCSGLQTSVEETKRGA
jgi:hypothetical protein